VSLSASSRQRRASPICGSLLAAFGVHLRVAMRILRHSKIAITMELYTMVPDEATLAALGGLATL